VLYISAMWVSGILQGLMWRAYTSLGFLEYSFIETVEAMHPFYLIRALGGFLFLCGAVLMVVNVWMTIATPEAESVPAARPALVIPSAINSSPAARSAMLPFESVPMTKRFFRRCRPRRASSVPHRRSRNPGSVAGDRSRAGSPRRYEVPAATYTDHGGSSAGGTPPQIGCPCWHASGRARACGPRLASR
jgi:hypothetical protein